MAEVERAVYTSDVSRSAGDLSDELRALRVSGDGFLWIGLKDPTPAEFENVNDELGLHPLAVEDAIRGQQRTKIDTYEGSLFICLRTLSYVDATSDVETGELMLFVGDRFVVTVRRGENHPLTQIRRLVGESHALREAGPVGVLHTVMDSVVDDWVEVDAELAKDLEELEEQVFSGGDRVSADVIYRLKREVLEARRAVAPLVPALRRIVAGEEPSIGGEAVPFFRDILDHATQVADHVDTYDRLLGDMLNAHLAQIAVKQNDDMRKISAWVAMAAVPTLLAGIWGMNFEHMPELATRYGYPMGLGLMVLAVTALYVVFKRSGWL